MGVFHHEEAPNPSKKCKFLAATLKDVFSNCDACCGWISSSGPDEDYPITDVVDESEVIVSEIRSRAMEKLRHKPFIFTDSFSWVEAFVSAEPNSSRCPSFDEFDFPKRSILQEFCQCQGWPFGLCRKAVLLPPLPKSPSESWSWRKGARIVKMA
ncbi:hypothetical protein OIU78_011922 [Salix suchowensis]|nr:hypothetical protein OIU78_011922 [Salix suchowensis]